MFTPKPANLATIRIDMREIGAAVSILGRVLVLLLSLRKEKVGKAP
jgi:hypothetical protein